MSKVTVKYYGGIPVIVDDRRTAQEKRAELLAFEKEIPNIQAQIERLEAERRRSKRRIKTHLPKQKVL